MNNEIKAYPYAITEEKTKRFSFKQILEDCISIRILVKELTVGLLLKRLIMMMKKKFLFLRSQ